MDEFSLIADELIDKLNPSLQSMDQVNGKVRVREFFKLRPEDAYRILRCIASASDTLDHLWRWSDTDGRFVRDSGIKNCQSASYSGKILPDML